ncbi:TIGR01459 family HAD-type hydrolase [Alkalicaulis satelles]|nr:TIGR01459 family HAD-type hydrolase [Alkalicaulis satelles]
MFDADVVSFAHGEGLRRAYPESITAMRHALSDPTLLPIENYMFLQKFKSLSAEITRHFMEIGVPPDLAGNTAIDAGTTRLIIAGLDLMAQRGDTVITFSGFYHPLAAWCAYRGLKLCVIPTSPENSHRPSAKQLLQWLEENAPPTPPILVLFNPSMTGAICGVREIEELSEVILNFRMWAIEDALFANCEFDVAARSVRLAAGCAAEQVLTVSGASKNFGLANMRIGWACGAPKLIHALSEYITTSSAATPQLSKIAALHALRAPSEYYELNNKEILFRINLAIETINHVDLNLRTIFEHEKSIIKAAHTPSAGHSILIDFSGFVSLLNKKNLKFEDSADLTRWILASAKVAFAPGQSHGFEGYQLRMNIASIGSSLTYPASLSIESQWNGQWTNAQSKAFEAGFAEGRAIIQSALTDRVEPVLRMALQNPPAQVNTARKSAQKPRAIHGMRETIHECDAVLMDVWGVLTDGSRAHAGAQTTLRQLAKECRPVILISNTSRLGSDLSHHLSRIGIQPDCYAKIVTGGDLAFRSVQRRKSGSTELGQACYVLGFQPGGHWADAAGLNVVTDIEKADWLLAVGYIDDEYINDNHLEILRRGADRRLPLLISNADTSIIINQKMCLGVGILAAHYQSMGGAVHIFGKPHQEIYHEAAMHAATQLSRDCIEPRRILVVGDSFNSDIAGAASFGAKSLLITATGVHASDLHPGGDGSLCNDTLMRLCRDHQCVPDMTLGSVTW